MRGKQVSLSAIDLQQIYDPQVYQTGVPFDILQQLRQQQAVHWIDEVATDSWPGGEGFLVRYTTCGSLAGFENPKDFSSWLGGTQLRNPPSEQDLAYVRQMMLNKDPLSIRACAVCWSTPLHREPSVG